MIIPDATVAIAQLSPVERSRYSFSAMAHLVERRENGESFAGTNELRAAGLYVEPFWYTKGDIEGDCYRPYIDSHPDFSLTVRQGVYERLITAQLLIPENWRIVLKAGFRPLEVQQHVLRAFIELSRQRNPTWSNNDHLSYARLFVADPAITCPPHTTGGAIDIVIRDRYTGYGIDMGCDINTDSDLAFLHSDLLTKEQYANRQTLLAAMLESGFAPNSNEWWHFQYGETYWAAFYGHSSTIYNSVG